MTRYMTARWPFRFALGFVIGYQLVGTDAQIGWWW